MINCHNRRGKCLAWSKFQLPAVVANLQCGYLAFESQYYKYYTTKPIYTNNTILISQY